jgi:hypothetical protein
MDSTITLNAEQTKLLKEFMQTDADVLELVEQLNENRGGDGQRTLRNHFENMCDKRGRIANRLAASLQMSFVAEQGPRVNPEGTASGAGTPA